MSYVLIDNATLTGVQRILGQIKIRTKDLVDADLVALENLVQAILLYDDILAVDDYKQEFSLERKGLFNFIRYVNPSDIANLQNVISNAYRESEEFIPIIRGGEFVDDSSREFFRDLKTQMFVTWDLSSSIFYLKLKMLGYQHTEDFERFRQVSASIFGELTDSTYSSGKDNGTDRVVLLDNKGRPIESGYTVRDNYGSVRQTGGMTTGLDAFISAVRWLAHRTIAYTQIARYLSSDLFLYPTRQAFQRSYLKKKQVYDANFLAEIQTNLSGGVRSCLTDSLNANRSHILPFTLPLFSAWIVSQGASIQNVLNAAIELRNDKRFIDARNIFREFSRLIESNGAPDASRTIQDVSRELEANLADIRRTFGVNTKQGIKLSNVIKTWNAIGSFAKLPPLPELGEDIYLRNPLKGLKRQSAIASLYRDVGHDLANFSQLGEIRDRLGAAVVVDPNAITYTPTTEDPALMFRASGWKIPM